MPVNMQILRDMMANPQVPVAVISIACSFLTDEEQQEVIGQLTPAETESADWEPVIRSMADPQIEAAAREMEELNNQADDLARFADYFRRPQPLNPQELGDAVDLAQGIDEANEEAEEAEQEAAHGSGSGDDDEQRAQEEREREEEEERDEEEREREREEHEGH